MLRLKIVSKSEYTWQLKKITSIFIVLAAFPQLMVSAFTVEIHNPAPFPRLNSVIEFPRNKITEKYGNDFIILDNKGKELPYQLTYNGLILIQSDFKADETKRFKIKKGTPAESDTICLAQIRHDFQDDLTWENDRAGYRLYGPSYREGGGNVAGYDVWTKSVDYPVLDQRYTDHCTYGITYHKDHGNGMDCYTVGRTLGAGMNALGYGDEIMYPCAYKECEILDNGPFRTSFRVTCYPEIMPDGTQINEERLIVLDKGAWLNKTTVRYKGLSQKTPLLTGIVVHKQNPKGYVLDSDLRYMAYADLTDNPDNGNGVIYIGIVNKDKPEKISYEPFPDPIGDATGQLISTAAISPDEEYTYYWGSGWSKGGVRGMNHWTKILSDFKNSLDYPFSVIIK